MKKNESEQIASQFAKKSTMKRKVLNILGIIIGVILLIAGLALTVLDNTIPGVILGILGIITLIVAGIYQIKSVD